MNTLLILSRKRNIFEGLPLDPERQYEYFASPEQAYLYQLENPDDVDSYLIGPDTDSESLKKIIRHIVFLNEIIPIFIFGKAVRTGENGTSPGNIKYCDTAADILSGLKSISASRRKYTRVQWPVSVVFHSKNTPAESSRGKIVSISPGGCLIRTEEKAGPASPLVMNITFRNFDFLVEGTVVRHDSKGYAVQFENITLNTQNVIKNIINEKILVELRELS